MFGLFSSLAKKIDSVFTGIGNKLSAIFSSNSDFNLSLGQMRDVFYQNDVSPKLVDEIIEHLQLWGKSSKSTDLKSVKAEILAFLAPLLQSKAEEEKHEFDVLILAGINGAGKTTFSVKLAKLLSKQKCKTLLVAADTFRAAAGDQLKEMANSAKVDLVFSPECKDPSSVIFDAGVKFSEGNYSKMIIDTAGRLHTKVNLINEFKKMQKVLEKTKLASKNIKTWLVLDGMLGQTNITQAQIFFQSIKIDGIVLTKLDSAGRCGSILSIVREFSVPVVYVSSGNDMGSIEKFDPEAFLTRFVN